MWEVKCTLCELVDMTCFASLKAQTIAQRSNVMFFFETLYRWHETYAFFAFLLCRWHGSLRFFAYVRLLPCHLQLLYIYIYFMIIIIFTLRIICIIIFLSIWLYLYIEKLLCVYIYIYGSRWSCAPVSTFSSGGFQCYKLHIGWAGCLGKGLPRTLQTATLLEWCAIPDTPPEWLPTTTTNSDRDVFFLDCAWRSGKQIWRIMG